MDRHGGSRPARGRVAHQTKTRDQSIFNARDFLWKTIAGNNDLFSSFNQRTTPEIEGTVSRVSADVSTDQRTGASFYTLRLTVTAEQIARLGGVRLVPGMPVEAFMQTEDRSVLSYLVKPLRDQVVRAFRER